MPLSQRQVVDQTRQMLEWRNSEKSRLDRIHGYWRGIQRLQWLHSSVPVEVKRFAEMARINVLKFVVDAAAQGMYVDGYRAPRSEDDDPAWEIWQANGMDARQIAVHRAAIAYGVSFVTVLPGEPVPVIRAVSPRRMTVVYGENDTWPMWALEQRRSAVKGATLYRLFDDTHTYWVSVGDGGTEYVSDEAHELGHVPVVRHRDAGEDDDEIVGKIEPVIPLQDQINLTTFSLLVAQHYGAHRQRYIIGWLAETEEQALKASAQKLWTFEDAPGEVEVGEFGQTDLKGYIDSREASLRHVATITQTPVHELLGQMVNLSAEALAAARDSHNRMLTETRTMAGESWEQTLATAGRLAGQEPDPAAWVRWRDMEARAFAATVDGLGKLVQMLGVPPQEVWERVPDVTQQEVERWKAAAADGDAFAGLMSTLERQAADAGL